MLKYFLAFFTILIFSVTASAQPGRAIKEAKRFMFFGNYQQALPFAKMLVRADTSNAYFNYILGECMFNIPTEKPNALPFLKRATQSTSSKIEEWSVNERNAPEKAWLYYARSLHHNYKFNAAIEAYKKYSSLCDPSEKKIIDQYIFSCKSGVTLLKDSIEISIENMGNMLNTENDEHTPVISSDENTIIFTSRRPGSTGNELADDGKYYEDIYLSQQELGIWSTPKGISEKINTPRHEASITLSYDGNELFIYKDDYGIGNIYYSKLEKNEWTAPQKLGSNINTQSNETHATLLLQVTEAEAREERIYTHVKDYLTGNGESL